MCTLPTERIIIPGNDTPPCVNDAESQSRHGSWSLALVSPSGFCTASSALICVTARNLFEWCNIALRQPHWLIARTLRGARYAVLTGLGVCWITEYGVSGTAETPRAAT